MRRLLRWLTTPPMQCACSPTNTEPVSPRPQANPRLIATEQRGLIPPAERGQR